MFTGLIEEVGTIIAFDENAGGARIKVGAEIVVADTADGDSIAVSGVCLTALDVGFDSFSADLSPETLVRTTLGSLEVGSRVNLERAVTPSTRLGGHIVQGHADSRGTFVSAVQSGDFWTMRIGFPREMAKYLVYKGSVCVEGISLTVAALGDGYFEIAVIPKTWKQTNLPTLKPGDGVNLEADVIAKYVERIITDSCSEQLHKSNPSAAK